MELLPLLAGLLALSTFALLLVDNKLPGAVAPLVAVCASALFFTLFGCFGALRLGGWLYYLLALCVIAYFVWRFVREKRLPPNPGFGFWLFVLGSLLFALLLWAKKPLFTTWDEFSFWGTAAKLTKLYDEFYTTAPVGWPWAASQTPTLTAFGYGMSFFARDFVPWHTYAASNILQLAAVAALLAPLGKRGRNMAFPVAVTGVLIAYVFTIYAEFPFVTSVYLTSLGDIPMGLLFGAALACYYAAREKGWKGVVPVYLILAVLTLTKDQVGLALALVVAGIVFCDTVFRPSPPPLKKRLGLGFARFGVGVVSALAAYLGWSFYLGAAIQVDRTSLGGTDDLSLPGMLIQFVSDLVSGGGDETFREVMAGMPSLFLRSRLTMLGSGLFVAALILALVLLAAVLAGDKAQRLRCIVYGAASTLCFVAYTLLIALTYIYIMRDDQLFASYERYMYPYYIGWFMGALALLCVSAQNARWPIVGKGAVLALCAVFCLRFWQLVPVQYSIFGVHPDEYGSFRTFSAEAQAIAEQLDEDDLLFIITTEDDGSRWFQYCYELLPVQTDYSFGGGSFIQKEDGVEHELNPDEWQAYLLEKGITHVLVDEMNDAYKEEYGHLFAGDAPQDKDLYRVEQTVGGAELVPVE